MKKVKWVKPHIFKIETDGTEVGPLDPVAENKFQKGLQILKLFFNIGRLVYNKIMVFVNYLAVSILDC